MNDLYVYLFIYFLTFLEVFSYTDKISLITKALFFQNITNNQTHESTVNYISGGDLTMYQLIKTIIATEAELISVLLDITTNLSCSHLKQNQIISLIFFNILVYASFHC